MLLAICLLIFHDFCHLGDKFGTFAAVNAITRQEQGTKNVKYVSSGSMSGATFCRKYYSCKATTGACSKVTQAASGPSLFLCLEKP